MDQGSYETRVEVARRGYVNPNMPLAKGEMPGNCTNDFTPGRIFYVDTDTTMRAGMTMMVAGYMAGKGIKVKPICCSWAGCTSAPSSYRLVNDAPYALCSKHTQEVDNSRKPQPELSPDPRTYRAIRRHEPEQVFVDASRNDRDRVVSVMVCWCGVLIEGTDWSDAGRLFEEHAKTLPW